MIEGCCLKEANYACLLCLAIAVTWQWSFLYKELYFLNCKLC